MRNPRDLLILAAGRLPQGRYGGSLAGLGAVPLGLSAVEGLLTQPALPRPGSLIWGMARSHTQGMNPARTVALGAGLSSAEYDGVRANMARLAGLEVAP